MEKKKWTAPNLSVIVRMKPEERILDGCKNSGANAAGSTAGSCMAYGAGGCGNMCNEFVYS